VIGWWRLRREAVVHGRGYWIRPLLLELAVGIGFAWLYWLEVQQLALWPAIAGVAAPPATVLHAQYSSHIVLISFMIVATFIDFDEQLIPDEITVTGTAIALLLAVAIPCSFLPTYFHSALGTFSYHHMALTSSTISPRWLDGLGGPFSWPGLLDGWRGLLLGLAGIGGWYFAILHKTWTLRRGPSQALRFLLASILRHNGWQVAAIATALALMTVGTWHWDAGGVRWQALLTAIVGMCGGGGLVWGVRIICSYAMRTEAMGFGDVTLMAMIGAFLGWQAALLTFFLAPVTALLIATMQRILAGQQRIAFGPYLCLAALIVIVGWDAIWANWASDMFSLGWFIPGIVAVCLPLMGGLLWGWRLVRDVVFGY
jgi:prepilin signal peptidase PulO-like enzyme (type II secretory pathway)